MSGTCDEVDWPQCCFLSMLMVVKQYVIHAILARLRLETLVHYWYHEGCYLRKYLLYINLF